MNISNLDGTGWILGEDYTVDDYLNDLFPQVIGKDVKKCPEETPFVEFNSTECVACQEGEYFDLEFRECSPCPEGTIYTEKLHVCINTTAEQLANCSDCAPGEIFDLQTFECRCPDHKPYKD